MAANDNKPRTTERPSGNHQQNEQKIPAYRPTPRPPKSN